MVFAIVPVGVFMLHMLLKLNWIISLILLAFFEGMVFLHRRKYRKMKDSSNRFYETCLYVDTMLYAFLRTGKIEAALYDTLESTAEGRLRNTLQEAVDHLELTFDENEVVEKSLQIVEEQYNCKRIKSMHNFMLHVEYYGGEIDASVELQLKDKDRWQKRIEQAMAERKKSFREVIMSIVASILICGCVIYMPMVNVDISSSLVVQIFSMVLLMLDDLISLKAQDFLNADWINLDSFWESDDAVQKLRRYRAYQPKKARRISLVSGGIVGGGAIALCVFQHMWIGLFLLLVAVILLNQHTIGHYLLKKNVLKELRSAFPNWLVDLALLLQSENVQVAIHKSKDQAPLVLLDDLTELENRLVIDPESARPFHGFLKDFQTPQITFAMSMLYSLSQGEVGDRQHQLFEMVNSNYRLLDEAERVRLRDRGSGLYLLFLAPVVTASIKLVVDMAIFMITFMGQSYV